MASAQILDIASQVGIEMYLAHSDGLELRNTLLLFYGYILDLRDRKRIPILGVADYCRLTGSYPASKGEITPVKSVWLR